MGTNSFRINVTCHGETLELAPHGDVDMATAGELREAICSTDRLGFGEVLVDLREVSFMDSAGLSALVTSERTLRQSGTKLVVTAPCDEVRRVMQITGIDRYFHIPPDQGSPDAG